MTRKGLAPLFLGCGAHRHRAALDERGRLPPRDWSRNHIALTNRTGRHPTEDAVADRRAVAAIIALRERIGWLSREGNRDGGGSRERGERLHHGVYDLSPRAGFARH